MPLYEYRCESCSHEIEVLQRIDDAPLTDCPECKKPSMKKKVVAPAFTFKGSGWYKDLYGAPPPKKDSSGDSATAAKPAEKSESKPSSTDSGTKATKTDS